MANVTIANYATPAAVDHLNAVWKLTRALKKAGWIYKASADGTAKDTTGTAGNDKWGGGIDPLTDTIPTLDLGSWWCAQGPSTLKLPITTAITGNFVRGENVIQAVTGAEGEILGAVFDTGSSTGWVVIAPRVNGSGADPRGWDHSHAITGALSGASFTPSATVLEFVTELVFWRSAYVTKAHGSWYFQCVDQSAEAASRFSSLASSAAGCTSNTAPGGGGTDNSFPTVGSWVPIGTGGAQAPQFWVGSGYVNAANIGKCQFMVANCTPSAGISADGSFIVAMGQPAFNAGSFLGFSLQRLDDTEEGDVCPFVTVALSNVNADNAVYNSNTGSISVADLMWTNNISVGSNPSVTLFRSWRRRGMASGDAFVGCVGAQLAAFGSSAPALFDINPTDAERAASDPSAFLIAEPVWVGSVTNLRKTRKGTLRWLLLVPTGSGCDTWAGKSFMQLASYASGVTPMIGGPWDGSSTPVNA